MNKILVNKKQFLKLFFLEVIGFIFIFLMAGFFIFFFYSNSVQKNSNRIINNQVSFLRGIPFWITDEELQQKRIFDQQNSVESQSTNSKTATRDINEFSKANLDTILFSKEKEILNYNTLGSRSLNYDKLNFKKISANNKSIQTINIGKNFYRIRFLILNHPIETQLGAAQYAAILYNFDLEKSNMELFKNVLFITLLIGGLLSFLISYIVTKKQMQPIVNAWDEQQDFVNNAAHELRTPLSIIQNKMENLLRNPNEKIYDISDDVVITLSEVRRLNQLTNNMLTLAKTGSNMTQLDNTELDIDDFIKEVTEPFLEIAEIENKKFIVKNEFKGILNVDKNRLHQLLVILLDNSLKYTYEKNKIELDVDKDKKGNLSITVKDTGRGISEETKKKAFERFYREDKSGNKETSGTGLGLSIAKWIVNAFGGKISIDNNHPKGTVFKITIPNQK